MAVDWQQQVSDLVRHHFVRSSQPNGVRRSSMFADRRSMRMKRRSAAPAFFPSGAECEHVRRDVAVPDQSLFVCASQQMDPETTAGRGGRCRADARLVTSTARARRRL